MEKKVQFRTSLIGGFKKADVIEYIGILEQQLENMSSIQEKAIKLQKAVTELLAVQEYIEERAEQVSGVDAFSKELFQFQDENQEDSRRKYDREDTPGME